MTRPKPKTVRAWAFATRDCDGVEHVYCSMSRGNAKNVSRSESWAFRGYTVGPVVRIEVPAPKERKR